MRHPFERAVVHDDAPTPDQLFELARRGIVLAKEHNRLRTNPYAKNPHSHFMMPRPEVVVPDLFEAPFGFRYEKLLSARLSKADRSWSMHFILSQYVTDMGVQRGSERHTYSFRWNHRGTTTARHIIRIMPAVDLELADHIDAFAALDELSGDWSWRTQLEQVTSGDIPYLIKDIEEYDWDTDGSVRLQAPGSDANFTAA